MWSLNKCYVTVSLLIIFNINQCILTPCKLNEGNRISRARNSLRRDNVDERGRFVEGDMIIPDYLDLTRVPKIDSRWKNSQLVYTIDPSFSAQELQSIKNSFNDISSKTCLTFKMRTTERDFVFIQRGIENTGCWSFVGRIGGKQIINLEPPICTLSGSISHELLHTLGRVHEQSRFDRDKFVTVAYPNVIPGLENNFRRYSQEQLPTNGVPYDYQSIMHYSAYAFSKNDRPTIVPKELGVEIGQRVALSARDAEQINRIYECKKASNSKFLFV